jgi:hypothetical protein
MVLARPDHALYVTNASTLVYEHPRSDELNHGLDYILYVSAHRDGVPFHVPARLDDSQATPMITAPALSMELEDEAFIPVRPRPLPPADGAEWVARADHSLTRKADFHA